jgi:hypothetical protein
MLRLKAPLNLASGKMQLSMAKTSCLPSSELFLNDHVAPTEILFVQSSSHYYGPNHPLVGILYLKLAKIMNLEGNRDEVLEYLMEAEKILNVTHGRSSSLFKQQLGPLLQQAKS